MNEEEKPKGSEGNENREQNQDLNRNYINPDTIKGINEFNLPDFKYTPDPPPPPPPETDASESAESD